VQAYAHIIAGLVAHKVRKGTAKAGDIRNALVTQGVSKSCAKRYMENGQKAKALTWVKAAGSDVDVILEAFAENDVKTEQDLVNLVSPKVVLTAAEELASKAKALTDTDEDALQALLDAAVLINPGCADVAATLVAALRPWSRPSPPPLRRSTLPHRSSIELLELATLDGLGQGPVHRRQLAESTGRLPHPSNQN